MGAYVKFAQVLANQNKRCFYDVTAWYKNKKIKSKVNLVKVRYSLKKSKDHNLFLSKKP